MTRRSRNWPKTAYMCVIGELNCESDISIKCSIVLIQLICLECRVGRVCNTKTVTKYCKFYCKFISVSLLRWTILEFEKHSTKYLLNHSNMISLLKCLIDFKITIIIIFKLKASINLIRIIALALAYW